MPISLGQVSAGAKTATNISKNGGQLFTNFTWRFTVLAMNITSDSNYIAFEALVAAHIGQQGSDAWHFSFYFGFYQDAAVPR